MTITIIIIINISIIFILFSIFLYYNNRNKKILNFNFIENEAKKLNKLTELIKKPNIQEISAAYNNLQQINIKIMKDLNVRIQNLEIINKDYTKRINELQTKIKELEFNIKDIRNENLELKKENIKLKKM